MAARYQEKLKGRNNYSNQKSRAPFGRARRDPNSPLVVNCNVQHEPIKIPIRLGEGPSGFEAGMKCRKYGSITPISKVTATRDLQYLIAKGASVLVEEGVGEVKSIGKPGRMLN